MTGQDSSDIVLSVHATVKAYVVRRMRSVSIGVVIF